MYINIDFNKEDLVQYIIQHIKNHFFLEPVGCNIKVGEEIIDIIARYRKSKDLVAFLILKEAAGVDALRRLVAQRELISRYLSIKREAILRDKKNVSPEIIRSLLNAANGVEGILIARSYADIMLDEISIYPWLQCYTYDFSSQINQTSSADLNIKMNFVFSELILTSISENASNEDLPDNEILNEYIKQNYIYYR
ncbi:hypothetical protein [Desulfolucanica intricata]|uniref:hypothetical protein n=1 Tax=Desulfolucanica intricata TaxID=1285191 RepID=UPI000832757A|nr:hypothetical protein [Desulfolucanica intricata]